MPHSRLRYAEPILRQLLTHSPIVGVLGQRQTGKTTLSSAQSGEYATLDLHSTLEAANQEPLAFLKKRGRPFTIDECQLEPKLFPALKEPVRLHPAKGQFILTGSVRFTSRKVIRESLTGRILNLELLPFSPAESHEEPLPGKLIEWLQVKSFSETLSPPSRWLQSIRQRFYSFLETGGLPGICFFRENHVRAPRFETHLETLLERDLRLILNTSVGYRQLKMLATLLALQQGLPLNFSALARKIGISPPSVKKIVGAMEGMFLVRTVSTESATSPVVFFEDQGTASYLMGDQADPQVNLVRGLFSCLLPQFQYRPELTAVFGHYRTRGGAKVDISIRTRLGTIGIVTVLDEAATASSIASARSFLANGAGSKVIVAHQGSQVVKISDSILSLPFQLLVSDWA